jgi:hypothetical protein
VTEADKNPADVGSDTNSVISDNGSDSSDLVITAGRSFALTLDRDFIVPFVLSLAIAGALIVFIVEAFEHSAVAKDLMPLLIGLAPIGAAIVNLIRCSDCRKGKNGASNDD